MVANPIYIQTKHFEADYHTTSDAFDHHIIIIIPQECSDLQIADIFMKALIFFRMLKIKMH